MVAAAGNTNLVGKITSDPSLREAPGLAGHNIKVFLGTTDKTSSVSFPLVLS